MPAIAHFIGILIFFIQYVCRDLWVIDHQADFVAFLMHIEYFVYIILLLLLDAATCLVYQPIPFIHE